MSLRPVKQIIQPKPTIEGAGVKLQRAFGFGKTTEFDPFLLLDDFRNDNPDDYRAGFPWHPHRGIETITYVLAGSVEHGDSLGNQGKMGAGDVQWMTAGSGILHQEMPKGDQHGRMHGFQLWANLPSSLKMTDPRYQDIPSSAIPDVTDDDGTRVRVICGEFWGKKGPVEGVAADPSYLDVFVPPGKQKRLKVETTRNAFAYVFSGSGTFRDASDPRAVLTEQAADANAPARYDARNHSLVLFDLGDELAVQAGPEGIRFLLVSGKPIEEPVAWYGPIVMNTQEQLRQAMSELQTGAFIKLITFFGGYGFNKSHSAAYALIGYQSAYLKAHYLPEFMAALLSSELVAEPRATMLEPRPHPVTHSWEKKEPAERVGISAHPINTAQFAVAKIACYPFFAFLVLPGFLARVETSRSAVPL